MQSLHVLLVDDERDERAMLREMLEERGFSVTEAASGRQAIGHLLAASREPDLLITDLRMPDMDGHTLMDLMAVYYRFSLIPVIVISATSPQREPLRRPVAVRLEKPTSELALLNAINKALGVTV